MNYTSNQLISSYLPLFLASYSLCEMLSMHSEYHFLTYVIFFLLQRNMVISFQPRVLSLVYVLVILVFCGALVFAAFLLRILELSVYAIYFRCSGVFGHQLLDIDRIFQKDLLYGLKVYTYIFNFYEGIYNEILL